MWWFLLSFNIAVREIDATHGLGHNEFVVNILEAAISGKKPVGRPRMQF
jgi:hypothetical protein